MGLVIEKTEVVYLKSFPCIVVNKTFQVTCGVTSFQIQKNEVDLILSLAGVSKVKSIPKADMGISKRGTGSTQDVWKIHTAWLR